MLPPSAGTSVAIAHHLNVEHWAIGNWALIPAVDAALFHCQQLNRVNINVGAHAFRERFGNVKRANTIGGERWRSIPCEANVRNGVVCRQSVFISIARIAACPVLVKSADRLKVRYKGGKATKDI